MSIDPKIAETIVESIKGAIQHDINFFNTQGVIIASTDISRVGTEHEGAKKAIATGMTINVDDSHPFEGAVNGINMPVMFNGSVIAVIGVTGDIDKVKPFGTIVKKMTEILIRENVEQIIESNRRMNMTRLMDLLILQHHDTELLDYLASALHVDLNRPRQSVIGRFAIRHRQSHPDTLRDIITRTLHNSPHTLFHTTGQGFDLLLDQNQRCDQLMTLQTLHQDIEREFGEPIIFGIGTVAETPDKYWRSYSEALVAVRWQLFHGQLSIPKFDDLDLGLIITSVPLEDIEKMVAHVFANTDETKLEQFAKVFATYTRHNGSITHAAQELYIHKNTMQNRLNAIATSTGYNPRKLLDYLTLAIAFELRDYLRFTKMQQ